MDVCFNHSVATHSHSVIIDQIRGISHRKISVRIPHGKKGGPIKKSAAKRYNIADAGAVETKKDDTSLSEQNELENKQLKKELDELKASLQLSDNELRDKKSKPD